MNFHNSYNFIPAPPRPDGVFGDSPPPGHHALSPDRLQGRLRVKMTVITPVVVGEPRAKDQDQHGHAILQLRSRKGGSNGAQGIADVEIPATSIKGVVRSAYEAITSSRFGVFGGTEALSFRSAPHEAVDIVPVRIEADGNGWTATPMLGAHAHVADGQPSPLYAAMLPDSDTAPVVWTVAARNRTRNLAHRAGHTVNLRLVRHNGPANYSYYLVTHVDGVESVSGPSNNVTHQWQSETLNDVTGYVCRTNNDPGVPIFPRKHDERVFFNVHPQQPLELSAKVVADFEALMESYAFQRTQAQHSERPSRAVAASEPWLSNHDLLYAAIDKAGVIQRLSPVMIGRRMFERSPRELLGDTLIPAPDLEHASMADRVFGMFAEQTDKSERTRTSYKGHLTFSTVSHVAGPPLQTPAAGGRPGGWVMAELAEPKPSAARFYVAADSAGTELARDPTLFKSSLYQAGQGLRGRKVYPHHRMIERQQQFPPAALQSELDEQRQPAKTVRNATVLAWLAPGSTFEFDIDFANLSRLELSALVWMLTPTEIASRGEHPAREEGYFRMGRGKGFGLGSVKLEIDAARSSVTHTDALTAAYTSMSGCLGLPASPFVPDVATFRETVETQLGNGGRFQDSPVIQAFRRAASGYPDRVEVRLPSATAPGPVSATVAWFQANERIARGEIPNAHPLPALYGPTTPDPLPDL